MEHRLLEAGIPFVAKPRTRREFVYRDTVVDVFEPDLLILDRLALELKHQPEGFAPANFTQLLNPTFRDRKLPKSPIKPLLVDRRVCVQIEAIHDKITARAVRTMQTHLRLTGCDIGIIACFGKTKLMICGVRR
jgi:hypothetical protein